MIVAVSWKSEDRPVRSLGFECRRLELTRCSLSNLNLIVMKCGSGPAPTVRGGRTVATAIQPPGCIAAVPRYSRVAGVEKILSAINRFDVPLRRRLFRLLR